MSDTTAVASARGVLVVTCLSTLVVNANTSAAAHTHTLPTSATSLSPE